MQNNVSRREFLAASGAAIAGAALSNPVSNEGVVSTDEKASTSSQPEQPYYRVTWGEGGAGWNSMDALYIRNCLHLSVIGDVSYADHCRVEVGDNVKGILTQEGFDAKLVA